jgi:hypothetical protein
VAGVLLGGVGGDGAVVEVEGEGAAADVAGGVEVVVGLAAGGDEAGVVEVDEVDALAAGDVDGDAVLVSSS